MKRGAKVAVSPLGGALCYRLVYVAPPLLPVEWFGLTAGPPDAHE